MKQVIRFCLTGPQLSQRRVDSSTVVQRKNLIEMDTSERNEDNEVKLLISRGMGDQNERKHEKRRKRLSKTQTMNKGERQEFQTKCGQNQTRNWGFMREQNGSKPCKPAKRRETPISQDPSILKPTPAHFKPSQHGEARLVCSMADY